MKQLKTLRANKLNYNKEEDLDKDKWVPQD
jgi:hypothetical protein